MPIMRNMPVYLTQEEFLAVLDDIRKRIEMGDSFEGSLSYEMPWDMVMGDPETDPRGQGFRVLASYRTGNRMGQGGIRMIGEMREVPSEPDR